MRHTAQHPNALRNALLVSAATLLSLAPGALHGAQGNALELAGLWEAKLRFALTFADRLTIERAAGAWRAEIAGVSTAARIWRHHQLHSSGRARRIPRPACARVGAGRGGGGAHRGPLDPGHDRGERIAVRLAGVLTSTGSAERWRGDIVRSRMSSRCI